jgi:hypothetical protein
MEGGDLMTFNETGATFQKQGGQLMGSQADFDRLTINLSEDFKARHCVTVEEAQRVCKINEDTLLSCLPDPDGSTIILDNGVHLLKQGTKFFVLQQNLKRLSVSRQFSEKYLVCSDAKVCFSLSVALTSSLCSPLEAHHLPGEVGLRESTEEGQEEGPWSPFLSRLL